MLKLLVFDLFVCHICGMERKICPICGNSNLREDKKVSGGITVCENEHYKHVIRGHAHFLIRTKRNRIEELSLQLATN